MQSRAIDLDNFLALHPLNFLLFYGNYELINTIYLDDGSPLVDLSMELFNQSTNQTVKFDKPPNDLPASRNNCHFYLSVEGNFTLEQAPEGWDFAVERSKSNTGDNFYFRKKEGHVLTEKPLNGSPDKIVLVLKNFRADPEGGTRTIRAEMFYGPLLKNKNGDPFKVDGYPSSYANTIFITNNRGGKKTLPLQVGFATGNAVLNDGTSTNTLELVIANKNWPKSNLPLSTDSQFVISFEMGDTAKEGAVATEAQVKGISITTSQSEWNVPSLTGRTEWPVTPKSGTTQLAYDDRIKLEITNLVTSHSSGSGYLYVRYSNIPNYPDGQFVVAIEKTPLLYRGAQVGIGTISPSEKLEVAGNIKATGAIKPSAGNAENYGIMFPKDPGGGQADAAWIRYYARTGEACTLEIGINNDATDHIALMPGGNVGIGTTEPSAKLHVNGNLLLSGYMQCTSGTFVMGSGTTSNNSIAWVEFYSGILTMAGKSLTFRSNSTESSLGEVGMTLTADGKIGIGTTSPSEKLHVGGNAIVSGKLAIGTTFPTTSTTNIDLVIGDNDTGLKQEEDGKLAIYTDNVERVRIDNKGNVGIGTTNPSAKLDVHGDFYIKGAKPMEYKFYTQYGDNLSIKTDYEVSTWVAIVAGFHGAGKDWSDTANGMKVQPWHGSDGKWEINCDVFGGVIETYWSVRVLFIKKELCIER
ncbi:MAG TPA: hypothetical protein V6D37_11100 [Candidatus Sericytochromatia bacterium]|jgi:hypothetical protein